MRNWQPVTAVNAAAASINMLGLKKFQRPFHKRFVMLENIPPSPPSSWKCEFGVRKAARQVDRIDGRHHLVLIAIRHQYRVVNA
jgi:hypothetical protein